MDFSNFRCENFKKITKKDFHKDRTKAGFKYEYSNEQIIKNAKFVLNMNWDVQTAQLFTIFGQLRRYSGINYLMVHFTKCQFFIDEAHGELVVRSVILSRIVYSRAVPINSWDGIRDNKSWKSFTLPGTVLRDEPITAFMIVVL